MRYCRFCRKDSGTGMASSNAALFSEMPKSWVNSVLPLLPPGSAIPVKDMEAIVNLHL